MSIQTVDRSQLLLFLQLLGRAEDERLVFAVYPPTQDRPCIHVTGSAAKPPWSLLNSKWGARYGEGYSLGLIINRPLPKPEDWGNRSEHRTRSGRIKAWGACNAHIDPQAVACWLEADGGLGLADQLHMPVRIGLPRPSFQVITGGKSVHHYWVLRPDVTQDVGMFARLQRGLYWAAMAKVPEAGWDKSLGNPCRVMRAPGGWHPSTGRRTVVVPRSITGELFDPHQLLAQLPATGPFVQSSTGRGGRSGSGLGDHGDHGSTEGDGWFSRMSASEQRSFAIEMLRLVPKRIPGTGTRPIAIRALAGLVHHFGRELAEEIVEEAEWFNEWWDPVAEIVSIHDDYFGEFGKAGIAVVIQAAREAGWQHPYERLQDRIKRHRQQLARSGKSPFTTLPPTKVTDIPEGR